jgi:hypothetical protein
MVVLEIPRPSSARLSTVRWKLVQTMPGTVELGAIKDVFARSWKLPDQLVVHQNKIVGPPFSGAASTK